MTNPTPQRISSQRVREIARDCEDESVVTSYTNAEKLRQLADQLERDAAVIEAARALGYILDADRDEHFWTHLCNAKDVLRQALADLDRTSHVGAAPKPGARRISVDWAAWSMEGNEKANDSGTHGGNAIMSVKEYIGDGVYAEDDGYNITMTTEDGISVTNRIVLEPEVARAFIAYYKRRRVKLHLPQDAEIDEDCR